MERPIEPYVCSECGEPCYFDGRCGDGPVLYCKCGREGYNVPDRIGFYFQPYNNAKPIPLSEYNKRRKI